MVSELLVEDQHHLGLHCTTVAAEAAEAGILRKRVPLITWAERGAKRTLCPQGAEGEGCTGRNGGGLAPFLPLHYCKDQQREDPGD